MKLEKVHWRHVVLALVLFLLGWEMPVVAAAVAAALGLARWWRWPRVAIKHYFTSRKAALIVVAALGGMGIDWVFAGLGLPMAVQGAVIAAIALAVLIFIFEGTLMKNIFDLVPADQQAELSGFLDGTPPPAAGQFADFHDLDPDAVTRSIRARIIGQDPIVTDVVKTAFRRARLRRPGKPVGVFLLVGATGSGKTELAKALAAEFFSGRMVRIDCNELTTQAGAQRLIGAPPGYVGSDRGGQLCRDIGRLGTGVILFDEIEKADPAVLKTIMGLLDEARLTEQSTGQTYVATGFLIVLTSNAQQAEIARIAASVADETERAKAVRSELTGHGFLPEVLARIDAIFPFAPLDRTSLAQIVGRFLQGFAHDAGVELVQVDAALLVDLVTRAEKARDAGVREVIRQVENTVTDDLLDLKDRGYTRAAIRVRDGHVSVETVTAAAAAQAS